MRLISLSVQNFAALKSANIEFGTGLNVLYGPNELGKSSLVSAIRAILLLPCSSRSYLQFKSWFSSELPHIELIFNSDKRRYWKVTKTFGSGKKAKAILESSYDGESFSIVTKQSKEVDSQIREILRWGIPGPEEHGVPRGIAQTFLTSALLGSQDSIGQIFDMHLGTYKNNSDRELLTDALQVLSQPQEFTDVLQIAETKTSEAYTKTGRRKGEQSPLAQIRKKCILAENENEEAKGIYESAQVIVNKVELLAKKINHYKQIVDSTKNKLHKLLTLKEQNNKYFYLLNKLNTAKENLSQIGESKQALELSVHKTNELQENLEKSDFILRKSKEELDISEKSLEISRKELEELKTEIDPEIELERKKEGLAEKYRQAQGLIDKARIAGEKDERLRTIKNNIKNIEEILPNIKNEVIQLEYDGKECESSLKFFRVLESWISSKDTNKIRSKREEIEEQLSVLKRQTLSDENTSITKSIAKDNLNFLSTILKLIEELDKSVKEQLVLSTSYDEAKETVHSTEISFHKALESINNLDTINTLRPKLEKQIIDLESTQRLLQKNIDEASQIPQAIENINNLENKISIFKLEDLLPIKTEYDNHENKILELKSKQKQLLDLQRYFEWKNKEHHLKFLEKESEKAKEAISKIARLNTKVASLSSTLDKIPNLDKKQLEPLYTLRGDKYLLETQISPIQDKLQEGVKFTGLQKIMILFGTSFVLGGGTIITLEMLNSFISSLFVLSGLIIALIPTFQTFTIQSKLKSEYKELKEKLDVFSQKWEEQVQVFFKESNVSSLEELEKIISESDELREELTNLNIEIGKLKILADGRKEFQEEYSMNKQLISNSSISYSDSQKQKYDEQINDIEDLSDNHFSQKTQLYNENINGFEVKQKELTIQLAKKETQLEVLQDSLKDAGLELNNKKDSFNEDWNEVIVKAEAKLLTISLEESKVKGQLENIEEEEDKIKEKSQLALDQKQKTLDISNKSLESSENNLKNKEKETLTHWNKLLEEVIKQITASELLSKGDDENIHNKKMSVAQKNSELERLIKDSGELSKELTEILKTLGDSDWLKVLNLAEKEIENIEQQKKHDKTLYKNLIENKHNALSSAEKRYDIDYEKNVNAKEEHEQRRNLHEQNRAKLAELQGESKTRDSEFDRNSLNGVSEEVDKLQIEISKLSKSDKPITDDIIAEAEMNYDLNREELRNLEDQLNHEKGALEQCGGDISKEIWQNKLAVLHNLEEEERNLEQDYGAWKLLLNTFQEAESEVATYLGQALVPLVHDRFTNLTKGRYGNLSLGADLNAQGIDANGKIQPINSLSLGTIDQLATLFRLSLAEQLQTSLLLDDQLVHSDSERMRWFKDILRNAASNIQLIVITCRPEDYLEPDEIKNSSNDKWLNKDGTLCIINLANSVARLPN